MLWIALAAQISAPQALREQNWFTTSDLPAGLMPESNVGAIFYRLTISPTGKIQNCTIEASSGEPKLDAYTCGIVRRKAHLLSARWLDGSPSYGIYRSSVVWVLNGGEGYLTPLDIEIQINRLPPDVRPSTKFTLTFAADDHGHPVACEPPAKANAALMKVACDQLMTNFTALAVIDEVGKPVRSVQTAAVAFVEAKR